MFSRSEWHWVALATALVVASSFGVHIAGWLTSSPDLHFTGIITNIPDGHSYIAKMRQGYDGQ